MHTNANAAQTNKLITHFYYTSKFTLYLDYKIHKHTLSIPSLIYCRSKISIIFSYLNKLK